MTDRQTLSDLAYVGRIYPDKSTSMLANSLSVCL